MSSSSYSPSRSSATHRRTHQTSPNPNPNSNSSGPQYPVLDQAPTPKPILQFVAFGLIVCLGLIQFLPATHFRHPSDPFRKWVPFNSKSSLSIFSASDDAKPGLITSNGQEVGMVHIVSWMECLDLRLLAVLVNSTLSSSRYQHLLHFHFFVPKGDKDKVSFYKLKVLFPHSNLDLHGQEEVKEVIRTALARENHSLHNIAEIAPFIIPSVHQLLIKFIYISPDVIVKGRVEELIGVDLGNYGIAAAEDCSERLNNYINPDVVDAIQRSASKPWVSGSPYEKNGCMPELSLLLIDRRKLGKDILEAFLWWTLVLNWKERTGERNPAMALVLYNQYFKLSNSWLVSNITSSIINESSVSHYDGPKTVCSEFGDGTTRKPGHGNLWRQHLPPLSDQIVRS